MKNFKQFLLEESVEQKPQYKSITVNEARVLLNENCKNALWMKNKEPFYRGDLTISTDTPLLVNSTMSTRRSSSGPNFHTEILDNHPDYKNFPKRSKSLVCTTDESTSYAYAHDYDNKVFVIIPYDDAGIGIVNNDDIWKTNVKYLKTEYSIASFNSKLKKICLEVGITGDSFSDLIHLDKMFKNGDKKAIEAFRYLFDNVDDHIKDGKYTTFLKDLNDAFSIKNTHMQICTTSNFHSSADNTELWIGGKVIMIKLTNWEKFKKIGGPYNW